MIICGFRFPLPGCVWGGARRGGGGGAGGTGSLQKKSPQKLEPIFFFFKSLLTHVFFLRLCRTGLDRLGKKKNKY